MPRSPRRHGRLPAGLSLGQRKALTLAERRGPFTLAQAASALGWSQDSAALMLGGLVDSGALTHERTTHRYTLTHIGGELLGTARPR